MLFIAPTKSYTLSRQMRGIWYSYILFSIVCLQLCRSSNLKPSVTYCSTVISTPEYELLTIKIIIILLSAMYIIIINIIPFDIRLSLANITYNILNTRSHYFYLFFFNCVHLRCTIRDVFTLELTTYTAL